jgi:hypothetical protein
MSIGFSTSTNTSTTVIFYPPLNDHISLVAKRRANTQIVGWSMSTTNDKEDKEGKKISHVL